MKQPKRYTVTSALPYANGPLHIGHIAGAYLPADIFVRYLRQKGEEVLYICGSDEHGAAITLRAKKENTTPKAIVDQYHELNKKVFSDFGIAFDHYDRTSSELHHQTAAEFFKKLDQEGKFIKQSSEQFYDAEHEQFLADRYVTGTCPKCNSEKAYGDQCESCGSSLNPNELINPISTLSGKAPEKRTTSHWYLPMQDYENWLKEWIVDGHKSDWKSNVYGQCKSWLDSGLQPRAMTRDLDWGVKVPVEGGEGKVLYVWLDAPIGYISATKKWAQENNKNWEDYWKSEETELIHFIGKDNIVFHCIIFPILLKAHGNYILPANIPANEFLNLEGDKISTSRNHAVWLHEYLEDFPDKQDELRYVLCSIAPESKDSEFTWKDYQARVNNELVAILGNFINRTLVLTQKYYDGVVPSSGENLHNEEQLNAEINIAIEKIETSIKQYRFRDALSNMMNIARIGNKYLADTEPWKLQKASPDQVETILHFSLQIAAKLSVVMQPFLPYTACKLMGLLNADDPLYDKVNEFELISSGHKINRPTLLFNKIEDEMVDKQINKLDVNQDETVEDVKLKPEISFDDFTKLDIRTGKILTAEKVEKADKLLKLSVDLGFETRTIVSGIAQHYKPEAIIGKTVTVLLNLQPRKIRGVESKGMILMAEDEKLIFVSPEDSVALGSSVS